MGCTSSKLDDLPAVALCRERCSFLDEAIRQRFALAESHVAYIHSLKGIGHSLHHFITHHHHHHHGGGDGRGGDSSPTLNLPPHRKGEKEDHHDHDNDHGHLDLDSEDDDDDESPKKGKLGAHHDSHGSGSASGSGHINFNSDDSDEEEGSDSFHHLHSQNQSPFHHLHRGEGGAPIQYMDSAFPRYPNQEMNAYPGTAGPGGGFTYMNYMKKSYTPPSVVYEHRPMDSQRVYFGESSNSSSYYPYPNNSPYFGYSGYGVGPPPPGIGVGGGGYYGGSSSSPPQGPSKPPPPPPSPPRASAWDFLNPFESYEKFYPPYTPSRDSRELREEEGIPDLEDEVTYQHEVVKEVQGNHKFVDVGYRKPSEDEEGTSSSSKGIDGGGNDVEAALYQKRPSVSVENEGMEYEVHEVEKKVVDDDERNEERRRSNAAAAAAPGGPRDVSDVAREIEVQFVRAAESGSEIAKMLEAGKQPYKGKHASSKTLHVVTPSLSVVSSQPSISNSSEASSSAGPAYLDVEEEVGLRSRNLSSTLHKLYLWEKKLYNEVKAEEKMRVVHDRKVRKLKRLDERGAEAHKVDATRTLVRSLSTKIKIAIQVVDKISVTINKIRDEELWPQLNELIHGLTRMWKSMLECHHSQCQAIREARGLGPIRSGKRLSDDHLEATRQLEHELINWTMRFSSWVAAQKGYVKALNNWLLKCLLYEPEETPDGIAPFSPGRIGAPPVFVICNQWSQALDRISENEVIDSMRTFTMSVLQLWEHDKQEMRQRMIDNKNLERKVRNLDREDQKIQKGIQALEKRVVLSSGEGNSLSVAGHAVYQSDTSSDSLQGSLQRIFEAMERFTADSMKVYEELLQRAAEESDA